MVDKKSERFMWLLEPLLPRLQSFAFSLTRDREDARDLIGDTIVVVWERFDTLKEEKAFLSFLFTVASRLHNQSLREKYMRERYPDEMFVETLSKELSPEDTTDINILFEAMDELPEKTREAIILFEIVDLPIKEIAKVQNTTEISIKLRILRGKKKLRKILALEEKNKLEILNKKEIYINK